MYTNSLNARAREWEIEIEQNWNTIRTNIRDLIFVLIIGNARGSRYVCLLSILATENAIEMTSTEGNLTMRIIQM